LLTFSEKLIKLFSSDNKSHLLYEHYMVTRVRLFKRIRLGSEPFISGDTFRSVAHVKVDKISRDSIKKATEKIGYWFEKSSRHVVLFIDLHCTQDNNDQLTIVKWLGSLDLVHRQNLSVIFHNHDVIPSHEFFIEIEKMSIKCYSPNALDNEYGLTPIPLGIENRYFQRNGMVRHFPKERKFVSYATNDRPIGLFGAFNIETNRKERQLAADSMTKYGHDLVRSRIKPREFRSKLSQSLFVISPPGNGIDCHRTWESIYFGAVPVVKRGKLAESIYRDLPIYVVEDWAEICSMTRIQLEETYELYVNRSEQSAYFDYWRRFIVR
jgi:hypothetical protein